MTVDSSAAAVAGCVGGALVSVVAGVDYATGGDLVARHGTPADAAHAVGFALVAVGALAVLGRYRAELSRPGRAALTMFTVLLAVFAVVSVPGLADRLAFLEPVAGLCFSACSARERGPPSRCGEGPGVTGWAPPCWAPGPR
jgi:hypothetical protein